jgi:hypothetical protein
MPFLKNKLSTQVSSIFYKSITRIDYFINRYICPGHFTFNGDIYSYFCHLYNTTWKCERAVEVPIIWGLVYQKMNKNILEVGNVLSHYFDFKHDIVDKYEQAAGVINVDVLDFATDKKYDLIVAISTLEHVGWDEKPKEPEKVLYCIDHLKEFLSVGGLLVFSIPSGYNAYLDELIRRNTIENAQSYHFIRIGKNRWRQSEFRDIDGLSYSSPWGAANGLTIIVVPGPINSALSVTFNQP